MAVVSGLGGTNDAAEFRTKLRAIRLMNIDGIVDGIDGEPAVVLAALSIVGGIVGNQVLQISLVIKDVAHRFNQGPERPPTEDAAGVRVPITAVERWAYRRDCVAQLVELAAVAAELCALGDHVSNAFEELDRGVDHGTEGG